MESPYKSSIKEIYTKDWFSWIHELVMFWYLILKNYIFKYNNNNEIYIFNYVVFIIDLSLKISWFIIQFGCYQNCDLIYQDLYQVDINLDFIRGVIISHLVGGVRNEVWRRYRRCF
jgi:hypothetical protein